MRTQFNINNEALCLVSRNYPHSERGKDNFDCQFYLFTFGVASSPHLTFCTSCHFLSSTSCSVLLLPVHHINVQYTYEAKHCNCWGLHCLLLGGGPILCHLYTVCLSYFLLFFRHFYCYKWFSCKCLSLSGLLVKLQVL